MQITTFYNLSLSNAWISLYLSNNMCVFHFSFSLHNKPYAKMDSLRQVWMSRCPKEGVWFPVFKTAHLFVMLMFCRALDINLPAWNNAGGFSHEVFQQVSWIWFSSIQIYNPYCYTNRQLKPFGLIHCYSRDSVWNVWFFN